MAEFIRREGRVLLAEKYYHGPLSAAGVIDALAEKIKVLPVVKNNP